MSVLERVFGIVYRRVTRSPPPSHGTVDFAALEQQLGIWAAALRGESVALQVVDMDGETGGHGLLLPLRAISRAVYLYRILHALTADELGFVAKGADPVLETLVSIPTINDAVDERWPGASALRTTAAQAILSLPAPRGSLSRLARALLGEAHDDDYCRFVLDARPSPFEVVAAARELQTRLPTNERRGHPPLDLWGVLSRRSRAHVDVPLLPSGDALPRGTELKSDIKGRVHRLDTAPKEEEQLPVFHVFEKLKTTDDYSGGTRPLDGSDELSEHAESLADLRMNTVVRTTEGAGSLLKVDGLGDLIAPELATTEQAPVRLMYPEWDAARRCLKRDWCSVFPTTGASASAEATTLLVAQWSKTYRRQIDDMKRDLSALVTERRRRRFQVDGDELDADALLDAAIDRRAGVTPTEKLFVAKPRDQREIATLVLLDTSLSSDGWVQNQRVLDVEREAVWVMAQVLQDLRLQLAVAAFHSHTRLDCRYETLKNFAEPWRALDRRLAAAQPVAYTRIGPALRHATHELSRCTAKRKLLLLLSDGKPTDYDRYEGNYGIADVRQAVREARAVGVHVKVLAVAASAKRQLPRMFDDYQLLAHPRQLPDALVRVFRSVTAW